VRKDLQLQAWHRAGADPSHAANLIAATAEIARASNGRLNIHVFPNSQLGGDTDMISQVRSGAIDFVSTAGLIWGTLVPAASISGIGFAFPATTTSGKQWTVNWARTSGAPSRRST